MMRSMAKDKKSGKKASSGSATPFGDALRAGPGTDLASIDTRSTPGFDGDKAAGQEALSAPAGEVSDLQERLFAESRAGGQRSVLLVVQGMDTAGKGGIMRHVVGAVDPQGVDITSFKAPTAEEKKHPFLWRIRKALPEPGQGPSAEDRAKGRFVMEVVAQTTSGTEVRTTVAAPYDPGYNGTAIMLGQSALSLAEDDLREGGGVLTPAVALGERLADRLRRFGFTLETA